MDQKIIIKKKIKFWCKAKKLIKKNRLVYLKINHSNNNRKFKKIFY